LDSLPDVPRWLSWLGLIVTMLCGIVPLCSWVWKRCLGEFWSARSQSSARAGIESKLKQFAVVKEIVSDPPRFTRRVILACSRSILWATSMGISGVTVVVLEPPYASPLWSKIALSLFIGYGTFLISIYHLKISTFPYVGFSRYKKRLVGLYKGWLRAPRYHWRN
jgi:hypothetical protein